MCTTGVNGKHFAVTLKTTCLQKQNYKPFDSKITTSSKRNNIMFPDKVVPLFLIKLNNILNGKINVAVI